jgi:hypothetical protein
MNTLAIVVNLALGFTCPKQNVEISKISSGEVDQIQIQNTLDRKAVETYGPLPQGNAVDPYQTRFGHYYTIAEQAQLSFPYAPEFIMVARLVESQKLFRKGFQAFEGQGKPVELGRIYCEALITAIRQHSFESIQ